MNPLPPSVQSLRELVADAAAGKLGTALALGAPDRRSVCQRIVADARKARDKRGETHGVHDYSDAFPLQALYTARANPECDPDRPTCVEVDQVRFAPELEAELLEALAKILSSNTVTVEADHDLFIGGKLTRASVEAILGIAARLMFNNIKGDDSGAIADAIETSRYPSRAEPEEADEPFCEFTGGTQ